VHLHLYGPSGFIERVGHKLQPYQWNLADRFLCDLMFMVSEVDAAGSGATAQFRLKNYFEAEPLPVRCSRGGVIHSEPMFWVATAILEHRTPCLAFALEEAAHVNIWKNRLFARGLPVGAWLRELKRAVVEDRPDDYPIAVPLTEEATCGTMRLGELRDVLTVTQGQKIGYVTDAADKSQGDHRSREGCGPSSISRPPSPKPMLRLQRNALI